MSYRVVTAYRDGDSWDNGYWEDQYDARDAAETIADNANPDIVLDVTVYDGTKVLYTFPVD